MPSQTCEPGVLAQNGHRQLVSGGNRKMHARPPVKQILIAKKMQKWALIGKYPFVNRGCTAARARKNYARLFDKYPEIAARLGLNQWSAF
jgi:hypothetical protein